jgi:Fe-S-cluster containining protein
MNELCQNCGGKCCVGEIEVLGWDEIYSDLALTIKVDDNGRRDQVMKTDSKNNCIALIDKKCTIYDKRPTACKEFTVGSPCCLKFVEGRETKHLCNKCDLLTAILERRAKIK